MRLTVPLTSLVFTFALTLPPAGAASPYSISDLNIGGVASVGINNAQQIVFNMNFQHDEPSNRHYLLDAGNLIELPTLGGRSHGLSVPSDQGIMVGTSQTPDLRYHAVVYVGGQLQDWGSLGERGSSLVDINSAGTIVGNIWNRSSTIGVIYDGPNDVTYLGSLGGNVNSVSDINNLGQITGISTTGASYTPGLTTTPAQEAFLYYGGQMSGIGTLGGHTSNGYAINDSGQIVGDSRLPSGETHAFVWDAVRGMRDIGPSGFQSIATNINNQGVIIGAVELTPGILTAAIFEESSGYKLLQSLIPADSGWQISRATDINDLGQIVGTGAFNGQSRAFLLTPIPEPIASVLGVLALLSAAVTFRTRFTSQQIVFSGTSSVRLRLKIDARIGKGGLEKVSGTKFKSVPDTFVSPRKSGRFSANSKKPASRGNRNCPRGSALLTFHMLPAKNRRLI